MYRRVALVLLPCAAAAACVFATQAQSSPTPTTDWAPIYGGLSEADAADISAQLQANGIPFRFKEDMLLVPREDVYSQRVLLAQKHLPAS